MTDAPLGLRERKRLDLRQRLSNTATQMFLEHGFDEVRVSDVAQACGVSTKTVWNHFPTKHALLFDRGERLASVLHAAARDRTDVVEAVVSGIREEVGQLGELGAMSSTSEGVRMVRAFVDLTASSPDLRAATAERLEDLTELAAEALATQTRTAATEPSNQILAAAVISLWRIHLSALLRATTQDRLLAQVQEDVMAEVESGAGLVRRLLDLATDATAGAEASTPRSTPATP